MARPPHDTTFPFPLAYGTCNLSSCRHFTLTNPNCCAFQSRHNLDLRQKSLLNPMEFLTGNPIGHTCVFVLTRLKISKNQQPFFPILQALIHLLRQLVAFCGNEEYISFLKYSCCNGKPQKAQLPAFHILLIQLDQILSILVTI